MKKDVKFKQRSDEEKKVLKRRLNIIRGQLNGIEQMIDGDRYCADILMQISSTRNAIKSLGNVLLKSHMESCVATDLANGNTDSLDEIIDLFEKLNR